MRGILRFNRPNGRWQDLGRACQRQAGNFDLADATVKKALQELQKRYKFPSCAHLINNSLLCPSTGAVPIQYTPHPVMKDWDHAQVRMV